MGAFGDAAFAYCDLGCPRPQVDPMVKRPLMRDYPSRLVNLGNVAAIARQFPDANIAILTGRSGLNVLDIDDLALLHPMRKRFGDTPLIGKTAGRGGYQLYYRASPHVRAADLRATDGIPVEIKAGGNIVITPPSRSPITGREYELIEGRFDHETLASLPQINVPAICDTKTAADHRSICEGLRDNWLFSVCLRHAHHVDDFDALLDVGRTRNDECEPPLPDDEVIKVCRSAWGYTTEGRNFVSAGGHVLLNRSRIEHLCNATPGNPVSLMLRLEIEHAARVERDESFALSTRAMADAGSFGDWSRQNLRTAIKGALDLGVLKCVSKGRGYARYMLPKPSKSTPDRTGLESNPNVTDTPLPPAPTARRRPR